MILGERAIPGDFKSVFMMLERRCEGIHLEVSNFWSFFGGQKCEASNGEFFAAKREEIRQE